MDKIFQQPVRAEKKYTHLLAGILLCAYTIKLIKYVIKRCVFAAGLVENRNEW